MYLCIGSGDQLWLRGCCPGSAWVEVGVTTFPLLCVSSLANAVDLLLPVQMTRISNVFLQLLLTVCVHAIWVWRYNWDHVFKSAGRDGNVVYVV